MVLAQHCTDTAKHEVKLGLSQSAPNLNKLLQVESCEKPNADLWCNKKAERQSVDADEWTRKEEQRKKRVISGLRTRLRPMPRQRGNEEWALSQQEVQCLLPLTFSRLARRRQIEFDN